MSLLKISLFATSVVAVGIVGYFGYKQFKKTTVSKSTNAKHVAKPRDQVVEQNTTMAVLENQSIEIAAVEHIEDTAMDGAISYSPPIELIVSETENSEPVTMLPLITNKTIYVHGFDNKFDDIKFLITNGMQQLIEPGMTKYEISQINLLHTYVGRHISNIIHHRGQTSYITQRSRIGRLAIKSFTPSSFGENEFVLIQIIPDDMNIFGFRTVSILLERGDLLIPNSTMDIDSLEWNKLIDVIFAHLTHALEFRNNATEIEFAGIKTTIRSHFLALSHRLMRSMQSA